MNLKDWFMEGVRVAVVVLCTIAMASGILTQEYDVATLGLLSLYIISTTADR